MCIHNLYTVPFLTNNKLVQSKEIVTIFQRVYKLIPPRLDWSTCFYCYRANYSSHDQLQSLHHTNKAADCEHLNRSFMGFASHHNRRHLIIYTKQNYTTNIIAITAPKIKSQQKKSHYSSRRHDFPNNISTILQ